MDNKERIKMEKLVMKTFKYSEFIKMVNNKFIILLSKALLDKKYPTEYPFKGKLIDKEELVKIVSGIEGIFNVLGESCDGEYVIEKNNKTCYVEKYIVRAI